MSSPTNMHHEMEFDEAYLSNDMHGHGGSVASYAYLATMITNYTVGGEVKLPDELILRARDTQTLYLWAPELSTFLEYPRIPPTSLLMEPVIDELSTPPVGPTTGDRYLVGDAATDAWVGMETYIAEYDGAAWQFTAAVEGNEVWITNDLTKKVYSGVVWHSEDPNVVDPSVIGNVPRFSTIHGEMEDSGVPLYLDPVTENLFLGTLPLGLIPFSIRNTNFGIGAGEENTSGYHNSNFGYQAGQKITTAQWSTNIGSWAGRKMTTSQLFTNVGQFAGGENVTGDNGTNIGCGAGMNATSASRTTNIGALAGRDGNGSGCVNLGFSAGMSETGSDKLYIDNQDRGSEALGRTNSLIYGIFHAVVANQYLTVNGHLTATESCTVPAPTTDLHAATKKYVDDNIGGGGDPQIAWMGL